MNHEAIKETLLRAVAVIGLAGIALIHVLDAHDTFVATPYKGWLYVGLIAGSLGTAGWLIRAGDARAWTAAALLSIGAIAAFAYSRTVGLPSSAGDIGNWWEPLGLSSLFVEGAVAAVAGSVLLARATVAPVRFAGRRVEAGAR
jgi:hypothetical protein